MHIPVYGGVPDAIRTNLRAESHFPANHTGYTADQLKSIQPGRLWTLQELEEIELEVMHWDGMYMSFCAVVPGTC